MHLLSLNMIIVTVNVALNKPTYQQNPIKQNYSAGDASNAVDDQKSDLTRNGGQCVVSSARETATWWVNLTSIHSIHNITVYYMTGNKPWGMGFFSKKNNTFNGFCYISNLYCIKIHFFKSIYFFLKVKVTQK